MGAPQFGNGTTNGAAWYPLTGGMQDYNYIWHGCMEVTLELSCCKYPPANELPQFWDDNRRSLLQFLGEAHRGVKGFVKDERAVPIEGAAMKVRNDLFYTKTIEMQQKRRSILATNWSSVKGACTKDVHPFSAFFGPPSPLVHFSSTFG